MPSRGDVAPGDDRDRHLGPVRRRRPQALGDVGARGRSRHDRLALAQRGVAAVHVDVEHRAGGDERRVLVAQASGSSNSGFAPAHDVEGDLGARHQVSLGRGAPSKGRSSASATTRTRGSPSTPLEEHEVAGEDVDAVEAHVGAVGDQLRPGRLATGSSAGVATSRKFSASSLVSMRKVPPWCSTPYSMPWRRGSTTRGAVSGRSAAMTWTSEVILRVHLDDHVGAVLGPAHAEVEALVGLLEDEDVVGRRWCPPGGATPGTDGWPRRAGCRRAVASSLAQATP